MTTQMQLSAVTPLSYKMKERSQWSHHDNKKGKGPMEDKKREEPESTAGNKGAGQKFKDMDVY